MHTPTELAPPADAPLTRLKAFSHGPYKFSAKVAADIFLLTRKGLTLKEVAHVTGISEDTLTIWQRDPTFKAQLFANRRIADELVVRSLFERATGYEYVTQEHGLNGEVVEIRHRLPPDVTACIFWLKNRQREHWKDRYQDDSGPKVINIIMGHRVAQQEAAKLSAEPIPARVRNGNPATP